MGWIVKESEMMERVLYSNEINQHKAHLSCPLPLIRLFFM